jgi:hypothetical protein
MHQNMHLNGGFYIRWLLQLRQPSTHGCWTNQCPMPTQTPSPKPRTSLGSCVVMLLGLHVESPTTNQPATQNESPSLGAGKKEGPDPVSTTSAPVDD